MPDVRNCKRCGRIYNYISGLQICQDCKNADNDDFKRVKEYLYEYPKSTIFEVSNALEISVERIKSYLKEGRLEIVGSEGNMILECERCGKSINTGRFCDGCSKDLTNDIKNTASQMTKIVEESVAAKRSQGMRYLSKDENKK